MSDSHTPSAPAPRFVTRPSRRRWRWLPLLALAGAAACASGDDPQILTPSVRLPSSVVVVNQSEFDITELRFHRGPDYAAADNLLDVPLTATASVVVHTFGSWFVTAMHEKNRGGPIRAYTSETAFFIDGDLGYRLELYNQVFRMDLGDKRPIRAEDTVLDYGELDSAPQSETDGR